MDYKLEQRSMTVYVAVILCTLAAIFDTFCGMVYRWPYYVYVIVWVQMGIILYTTFDKRVSIKVQSMLFCTFTFITVFLSGFYFDNYVIEILLLCGTMVLASFYHNRHLVIYQMSLSVLGIIVHCVLFSVVDFTVENNVVEFCFSFFLLVGIGGSLYFNICRDDRVREKLRDTARRAEQAERSKSDFLANMSHEIRTPMNAIIGMCELALRESGVPQGVRDCCVQIQNSGRSLLSIINDILDFSKIESGKMQLTEEEFNLSSTINDVVNMTMTRMGDKDLEFIVQVDPTIPRGLVGDEIRIRQIMVNLLTNAVKYTPKGVINLHVSRTVRQYGINLNVSVRDSGIGIKKENLEKLFSSFQQVDTRKNRAVEGTGLGLVITKRLLTSMGGFINVESEYGKGSEFRFVIPLKVSDPTPFVQVNEADSIVAACYIDVDKYSDSYMRAGYRRFLQEISESIPVRKYMCRRFEDLKLRVDRGMITHCFIGKEEYLANKAYFESVAKHLEVIIVQNRKDGVVVPSNMRCIYKPVYEVPIAAILNDETLIQDLQETKNTTITFTAPKARVLIVDDNAVNLQVAAGLMQPYQMQICTVESGRDALRILNSKDFDLVFMDHMMPELDGVETTKMIRSKPEEYYQKLPIIALTANAVGGAREMFLENGFDGFLAKPMELSALDRVLKQHLPQDYIHRMSENRGVTAPKTEVVVESEKEVYVSEEAASLIDAKTGLFYVGNSVETYLTILKTYVEKGKDKLALLNRLFEEEDWKNYVIEVHALKSSSMSVGAKSLSEKAKKLELSGKAGDYGYIREHQATMLSEYELVLRFAEQMLCDNIQKPEPVFEGENAKDRIVLSREDLIRRVRCLKDFCKSFDSDEIIQAAEEGLGCEYQGKMLTEEFRKISKAADDFDYDNVVRILDEMVITFGLEDTDA